MREEGAEDEEMKQWVVTAGEAEIWQRVEQGDRLCKVRKRTDAHFEEHMWLQVRKENESIKWEQLSGRGVGGGEERAIKGEGGSNADSESEESSRSGVECVTACFPFVCRPWQPRLCLFIFLFFIAFFFKSNYSSIMHIVTAFFSSPLASTILLLSSTPDSCHFSSLFHLPAFLWLFYFLMTIFSSFVPSAPILLLSSCLGLSNKSPHSLLVATLYHLVSCCFCLSECVDDFQMTATQPEGTVTVTAHSAPLFLACWNPSSLIALC